MPILWTEERVARLRALVRKGRTCWQIGETFGVHQMTVRRKARELGLAVHKKVINDVWTEERENQLRYLVELGYSAHIIAVEIGAGLTRNAVIGKCGRMGLQLKLLKTKSKPRVFQVTATRPVLRNKPVLQAQPERLPTPPPPVKVQKKVEPQLELPSVEPRQKRRWGSYHNFGNLDIAASKIDQRKALEHELAVAAANTRKLQDALVDD